MAEVQSPSYGRRMAVSGIGAVAAILAASSCCIPLLPFLAAAGTAAGSGVFTAIRPYLLGLSVLLIIFGFYQSWRAKKCQCKPSLVHAVLLWTSAFFVAVAILFPQAVADLVARIP